MFWPRLHRWLAIILLFPLVAWSGTGLLFHVKPGWARAYDMLSAERPLATAGVASIETVAATFSTPIERVELFGTALGPMYRITTHGGVELVDAAGARRRSPLTADDARELAADAVAHSRQRELYGAIGNATVEGNTVHVGFAHATVDVDRASGKLTQRGTDTDRIDWLYRIHYLQWSGNPDVDRVIPVVGLGLIWIVAFAGLVLFFKRWRQ
jgi:hypothetical protein